MSQGKAKELTAFVVLAFSFFFSLAALTATSRWARRNSGFWLRLARIASIEKSPMAREATSNNNLKKD